ncbi:MAG TPA: deoxyribose-phosphate aldolase [Actinomycetota bacterium]|nr:deoxyribose-phosphate aldolase [Actinomycetota bacterium]
MRQPSARSPVPAPFWDGSVVENRIAGLPSADAEDLEARAQSLTRSPPAPTTDVLRSVIRCLDLTSLEGRETAEDVAALCDRAADPGPGAEPVAAVVIDHTLVAEAVRRLADTPVRAAAVAGGFPTADGSPEERLAEVRRALAEGAEEIDVPLPRVPLMEGGYRPLYDELVNIRVAAGDATLKVILETGRLGFDEIRRASWLAAAAGADFLKTSSGKMQAGATPSAALCMAEAARDFHAESGRPVGVKVSGGVRTWDVAGPYVSIVEAILGAGTVTPERFRIGASRLLDDLVDRLSRTT